MRSWVIKKLEDVCTLQRGFDLPKRLRKKGEYPLISSSGCIDIHVEAKVSGPGVVTGRSGSIGSVFFIEKDFWPLNTTLYVKNFHGNDPRFIFYLLNKFDLSSFSSGAGVPTLNRNTVHSETVYVPTNIIEQKRIVAILDEAFEGIDRAIANTEKNLANARELFESYLNGVFSQKGEGWVEKKLSSLIDISHGYAFKGGDFNTSNDLEKQIVLTPGNYSENGRLYFNSKNTKRLTGTNSPNGYLFNVGDLTIVMTDLSSKMKILGKPAFIEQPNILHNLCWRVPTF
ncbi:restriction endonuclease subunit S [Limnospira fusiformis]|uniref:restriction endonuclease subunit S n=1 Tax=Limnospira fusiformis TaxID=54297 RepID=UPI002AA1B282|nr:restriction endonuclease subunit S [Limnospira fusiformis LS22]